MSSLSETPRANRIHIAFFGLRNAGKSTLVNAFTGQELAIVSDVAGTTTDPVSKAMEILPLGPCLVTDTAGLDDAGALGRKRVEKSLAVLATTDVAVWVRAPEESPTPEHALFLKTCAEQGVTALEYDRREDVASFRARVASVPLGETEPDLLEGLVSDFPRVVCVCPIDASAPKGRLILPQVQTLRACLDRHLVASVCQPEELAAACAAPGPALVITDSQAFASVSRTLAALGRTDIRLTSFSILFARQKGDLAAYLRGLAAARALKPGATVLVAEGCTHHRQCGDIGTVKIPKALEKLSGARPNCVFASGATFEIPSDAALVVQCGGCMLTRREVRRRLARAAAARVPIVNYGLLLAAAAGLPCETLAGGCP